MEPATIKIFLVDGKPQGLRIAEISNWTGKALSCPRSEISELIKRPELPNPGIYLLTGFDPGTGEPALYVGESENISNRIKNHSEKDFWNNITVFVSKDENLTKSNIKYLEGSLIKRAKKAEKAVLENTSSSGAKLPESDTAEMDVFLNRIFQLLPILGITLFNVTTDTHIKTDELYCKIKGLVAKGNRTENGFVVYKGSQAVLEDRPSSSYAKKRREVLIKDGSLKNKGDHYIFTKNVEFGSSSTAGSIIRGGNTNGPKSWKTKDGTSQADFEKMLSELGGSLKQLSKEFKKQADLIDKKNHSK